MEQDTNENIDYSTLDYFLNSPDWQMLMELPVGVWVNDLKNQRNGKLVAYFPFKNNAIKDPSIYWLCKCDCGSFIMLRGNKFKELTHCGCEDNKDYVGSSHDHLTCTAQHTSVTDTGFRTFKLTVKCDCGKTKTMTPAKFENAKCCGLQCPLRVPDDTKQKNGKRIQKYFFNGTNVSKIGRKDVNKNNTTGYLGVSYNSSNGKYLAYITFQGKREDLGYYDDPEIAYKVRIAAQDILQAQFIQELNDFEFIKNNKHLSELLNKVKLKLKGEKKNNG